MFNLLRMDLRRLFRRRSFKIILLVTMGMIVLVSWIEYAVSEPESREGMGEYDAEVDPSIFGRDPQLGDSSIWPMNLRWRLFAGNDRYWGHPLCQRRFFRRLCQKYLLYPSPSGRLCIVQGIDRRGLQRRYHARWGIMILLRPNLRGMAPCPVSFSLFCNTCSGYVCPIGPLR